MIDALADQTRLVLDVELQPVVGSAFQPTGFPNLGAAEFERPGQERSLLVESVQSMTNHLEAVGWNAANRAPIALLAQLPWIGVHAADDGELLTSSRQEPHRLAAAYVRDATIDGTPGTEWLREQLGLRDKRPLSMPLIHQAIYELDPLCLLHGVFFSDKQFPGNPKVRRAITAVIEARNVSPVVSGGLKRDDVQHSADQASGAGAKEGYGFVPFNRTEYTAEGILLTAAIDLHQIRGYGLDATATRLLELLALWEVVALLDEPLRLRTACDLEVKEITVRRPAGFRVPSRDQLEDAIGESRATFTAPGERVASWAAPKGK